MPITVEDLAGRAEAGEEGRLDVAARADLRGAARGCCAHPYRRMRLLVAARPDVDRAVMKEAALVAERSIDLGTSKRSGMAEAGQVNPVMLWTFCAAYVRLSAGVVSRRL